MPLELLPFPVAEQSMKRRTRNKLLQYYKFLIAEFSRARSARSSAP